MKRQKDIFASSTNLVNNIKRGGKKIKVAKKSIWFGFYQCSLPVVSWQILNGDSKCGQVQIVSLPSGQLRRHCFQSFCLNVYHQKLVYLLTELLNEKHLFLDDLENIAVET